MQKLRVDLDRLPRPVLMVLIIVVLISVIYLRFINPGIISNLVSSALENNPLLFVIILLVSISGFVSTSLWLIRYGKKQGGIGKLLSLSVALRLGIILIFVILLFLLLILWALVKLLQYLT